MTEFFLSFAVLLAFFMLAGVGVLLARKPLKGSCGGLSALKEGESCSVCGAKGQPK